MHSPTYQIYINDKLFTIPIIYPSIMTNNGYDSPSIFDYTKDLEGQQLVAYIVVCTLLEGKG